jgi:peptidoglycan hydrolase CwlO-like protein
MTPSTIRTQMTPSTVRTHMTPSTVRRTSRTPSPNSYSSRKGEDTTNLLLDFTAQIEAFGARHGTPSHGRTSSNSTIVPNLLSHIQNQRSPAKSSSYVPSTPSQKRQGLINLLDFELPPPPTPRSVPTVTIRELESLKSNFQSQISSLTASLSGKEAQVESLVKAIADAEHRVGEAQENFRDECSARDYAEAQMVDWKKKGEEVQRLLQDVQSEMARTDTERFDLLSRISEFEKRTEDAEMRAAELETRAIEAESRNVDMTTFITPEESDAKENRKIYSEVECQAAIAEKVNEVARDLHSAYKAKHEKKIRALKDNYQKKADERCKELRVQIIRLERQIEEMEKKHDDTFSKVVPGSTNSRDFVSPGKALRDPEDLRRIEEQRFELETVKSKLAGLMSELESLRNSNDSLLQELEMERVEKADLVHAAEEMLTMCAAQMEEKAAEDVRKSTPIAPPTPKQHSRANSINNKSTPSAPPTSKQHSRTNSINNKRPGSALSSERPNSAMGERKGSMGESHTPQQSGLKKPSGLRAPGGFGFGRKEELSRSTSGSKSRIMSNIERMGGGRTQE